MQPTCPPVSSSAEISEERITIVIHVILLAFCACSPPAQARALTAEICRNVQTAARAVGVLGPSQGASSSAHRGLSVILRGDSTLRGHFPAVIAPRNSTKTTVALLLLLALLLGDSPLWPTGGCQTEGATSPPVVAL